MKEERDLRKFSLFSFSLSPEASDLPSSAPMKNFFFHPRYYFDGAGAVGLLILRLLIGCALAIHGFQKIQSPGGFFGWMGPDVPGFLQGLATFSEFFGGLALIVGLLTQLACLGVMSTMFVAVLSTFTNAKMPTYFIKPPGASGDAIESALGYFVIALAIFLIGPGLLSIDAILAKLTGKRATDAATPLR